MNGGGMMNGLIIEFTISGDSLVEKIISLHIGLKLSFPMHHVAILHK